MKVETTSPRKPIERTMGQRSRSAVIRSFKKFLDGESEILTHPDPNATDMAQRRMKVREWKYRSLHDVFMRVCDDVKD